METAGIIKWVGHRDWAAPIVVVPKANGSVATIKLLSILTLSWTSTHCPCQRNCFQRWKVSFDRRLDLSQDYLQLELDEAIQQLCTVNTPFGLFKYTRMPFGSAPAPANFQRVMEDIFRGLPCVKCYLDDILIAGSSPEQHWERVFEVLRSFTSCRRPPLTRQMPLCCS